MDGIFGNSQDKAEMSMLSAGEIRGKGACISKELLLRKNANGQTKTTRRFADSGWNPG